jgi:hypothetical protein
MRIAGAFLLLSGLLLCVSIIWAAVGFLMMGFGLICLLIAERKNKRSTAPAGPLSDEVDRRREPPPLQVEKQAQSVELVEASPSSMVSQHAPSALPEPRQPKPPKQALSLRKEQPDRRRNEPDTIPYDREKWRVLVRSDADISRSVEAMQPFGKKYVDQLAMTYLVFEEKSYLPTIVKLVANAIKKDSGRDSPSSAATAGDPNADLISFAMSKARSSIEEQIFASPALNGGFTEKSSVMRRTPPQAEPDARARRTAAQSELKTAPRLPEGRAVKRQPDARGMDEGEAARIIAPVLKAAGGRP